MVGEWRGNDGGSGARIVPDPQWQAGTPVLAGGSGSKMGA
jgi:hypothetical protein